MLWVFDISLHSPLDTKNPLFIRIPAVTVPKEQVFAFHRMNSGFSIALLLGLSQPSPGFAPR
jgi:hypothetical protein